jgi:hypothetical protein
MRYKAFGLIAALVCLPLQTASAQYLGGIVGEAKGWVEGGCGPCCFVTNKSQKRIRATVSLALGASVTETVFPGDKKVFMLGNQCVTSAFGLHVDFIPDDK